MWDRIKIAIGNFLTKFTYHQRFWFFWAIFAFGVPIPTYLLFTMQSYLINNVELELMGNRYQAILGNLHYKVAKHQVQSSLGLLDRNTTDYSKQELKETINLLFNELKDLDREKTFFSPLNLGDGFSTIKNEEFNVNKWKEEWDRILDQHTPNSYEENTLLHHKLMEVIYRQLQEIGYAFGLFLDTEMNVHHLVNVTISGLPRAQYFIAQIFSIREWIFANQELPEEVEVSLMVMKNSLSSQLNETVRILHLTYQDDDQKLSKFPLLLLAARQALVSYHHSLKRFVRRTQAFDEMLTDFNLEDQLIKEESFALKVLNDNEDVRTISIHQLRELLKTRLYYMDLLRMTIIVFYTVSAAVLTIMGLCRTFSGHLIKILNHIKSLAAGDFAISYHLDSKDEFGQLGIAINTMVLSVQQIVGKLQELGRVQTDSSEQIAKTATDQEKKIDMQQKSIQEMERTAEEIATGARTLANTMYQLTKASKQTHMGKTAEENIQRMETKMRTLATSSEEITTRLAQLQEEVRGASGLITFMARVSEQAKMLALNAAIEAVGVGNQKKSFLDVTQEIQRFATKTSTATQEILKVIDEMLTGVTKVRKNANQSLEEISRGASRLGMVSQQVGGITQLVEKQIARFKNINEVMQEQANDAEQIKTSIKELEQSTGENAPSIRQLHKANSELSNTANRLQKTLAVFFHDEEI